MIIDRFIFKKHLEKGENILYVVHKHWIEIIKISLEVVFFGLAPPWLLFTTAFSSNFFFWIAMAWTSIALIRFFYVLVDWYSDAWLITSMSIIAIEWNGLFSNNATRIDYDNIEGASYEIKGFWGTILRFGNMTLRVMSGSHTDMKNVSSPKKAELALMRCQDKYMSTRSMQDSNSLKSLLSNMVAHHNKKQ